MKDKYQPTFKLIGSSTELTLQKLKKEAEKKKAADEAARVICPKCTLEIAPNRKCHGHGKGAGGGGGSGGGAQTAAVAGQADSSSLKKDSFLSESEELMDEFSSTMNNETLNSAAQVEEDNFDPALIADLIAQGLLLINLDPESKTLTISLQCTPESLSAAQRKALDQFMVTVLKECNSFKEQHHLSEACINLIQNEKELSLRFKFPTLALQNAFFQQLVINVLPTPLSMEPKPAHKSRDLLQDEVNEEKVVSPEDIETEEEEEIFDPSPLSMTMKPK